MTSSVSFNAPATVSSDWTTFKSTIVSKNLYTQYSDDGTTYTIFAFDNDTVLYVCTIWKGTVPPSTINGGYSQAQNDSDKSDFETNYKNAANIPIQGTQTSVDPTRKELRTIASPRLVLFKEDWYDTNIYQWQAIASGSASVANVQVGCLDASITGINSFIQYTSYVSFSPSYDSSVELRFMARINVFASGKQQNYFIGFGDAPASMAYATPLKNAIGLYIDSVSGTGGLTTWKNGTLLTTKTGTNLPDTTMGVWHKYRLVWAKNYIQLYVDNMDVPTATLQTTVDTATNTFMAVQNLPVRIMTSSGGTFSGQGLIEISAITVEQLGFRGTVSGALTTADVGSRQITGSYAGTCVRGGVTGSASAQTLLTLENPSGSTNKIYVKRAFFTGFNTGSSTTVFNYQITRCSVPSAGTTATPAKIRNAFPTATGIIRTASWTIASTDATDLFICTPGTNLSAASVANPEMYEFYAETEKDYIVLLPGEALTFQASGNATTWHHWVSVYWDEGDDGFDGLG